MLRQIPVLQLTGESGDPVMIRFGVGPHQATADFIAATRATLARWLPAAALTGNTKDPVNPTHFLGVGVPLVVAAMVVSIMGGYVAGAVVITRAKSSPTLSSWIRPDRAIGVPGYYTYGGPHKKPIQLGAPFGRPCKPIVVRFEDSVPAAPYQSFVDVVQEAHAAGVNITITERNGAYLFSQLYPPGQRLDTVQIVAVFADKETPKRLTSGTLEHFSFGWDAVLAEDGRHEYVTDVNIKLHLSSMEGDAAAFREAALGFVGFTQGIAVSTAPGSAFAAGFGSGADKFSARDIDAMLTMSGCPPTPRATHAPPIPARLNYSSLPFEGSEPKIRPIISRG